MMFRDSPKFPGLERKDLRKSLQTRGFPCNPILLIMMQEVFSKGISKSRDPWLLYLGGIPANYALWVVGTRAPAMFQEVGVESLVRSSFYSSLLGIAAMPGLSLTGFASDRLPRKGKGRKGRVLYLGTLGRLLCPLAIKPSFGFGKERKIAGG